MKNETFLRVIRRLFLISFFIFSKNISAETITIENSIPTYNIASRYELKNRWNFYVKGEFVYWKMMEQGLELASTGMGREDFFNGDYKFYVYDMNPKFKKGFKIGLGLNSQHDSWTLFAQYSRIHTVNRDSYVIEPYNTQAIYYDMRPGLVLPWVVAYSGITALTTAGNNMSIFGTWFCYYDNINLDLLRKYYFGSNLTFKPFLGLELLFLDQKYNFFLSYPEIPTTGYANYKSDSWQCGPRLGIDMSWLLSKDFKLIGNSSFSVLYANYKLTGDQNIPQDCFYNVDGTNLNLKKYSPQALREVFTSFLGIEWSTYAHQNGLHLELSLKYEFQYFWNQNMMRYRILKNSAYNKGGSPLDLFIYGLTGSARLDF